MSTTPSTAPQAAVPFDPLDMRNYGLEKLQTIAAGPWMARLRLIGVPLAILAFMFFHFKWCGSIELYDTAKLPKGVELSYLYSATGVFVFSLILWLTESIPSYLTSFIIIVAVVMIGILPMRASFAYLGEPVEAAAGVRVRDAARFVRWLEFDPRTERSRLFARCFLPRTGGRLFLLQYTDSTARTVARSAGGATRRGGDGRCRWFAWTLRSKR